VFVRRWLSEEHGELPSPVQAACWLDIKRTYMALRPSLRRVYTAVEDLPAYAEAVTPLGFQPLGTTDVDGIAFHSAVIDFGPESVDGWLAGLVAAELGLEDATTLDQDARELVLGERRVPLTKLEFALLRYLADRPGKAVSRATLIEDVWGYSYTGGSNVVDAAVWAIRKKLGDAAAMIETVTGIGYRFRNKK